VCVIDEDNMEEEERFNELEGELKLLLAALEDEVQRFEDERGKGSVKAKAERSLREVDQQVCRNTQSY
jgi:hypothetical protein